MISIKCPHCHVGLKVDERKLPPNISSFKCPKCKEAIPISLLYNQTEDDNDTIVITSRKLFTAGKITVSSDENTPEQTFKLFEGINIIGRKSQASKATIGVITTDKSMSREHIIIEVKKETKENYKHYLSDNNSKNHTLYNGNYLENGEVVVLNDNDEIIIGRTILRFNE
ncbi:FHA domain-containing protein [Parabacteroides sp. PF5-9]|uniref:DUF7836 family putative zinc-binding protein n=1 Tax=Parabacteroides sp. PF5-9 TaxID=1742404 RepID=UPI0024763811|nr:FHA domain-containing protein [Parabacteroides sp. PF5-9]MDH6356464.1 putative Zn finger-like uncharacterized protein [Parabacteroides sp. PF5-9]